MFKKVLLVSLLLVSCKNRDFNQAETQAVKTEGARAKMSPSTPEVKLNLNEKLISLGHPGVEALPAAKQKVAAYLKTYAPSPSSSFFQKFEKYGVKNPNYTLTLKSFSITGSTIGGTLSCDYKSSIIVTDGEGDIVGGGDGVGMSFSQTSFAQQDNPKPNLSEMNCFSNQFFDRGLSQSIEDSVSKIQTTPPSK